MSNQGRSYETESTAVGQFGYDCDPVVLLAQVAIEFSEALSADSTQDCAAGWTTADAEVFDAYYVYEHAVHLAGELRHRSGPPTRVVQTIYDVRVELPFSEMERCWLFGIYAGLCAISEFQDSWDFAKVLAPIRAKALSAGQPTELNGEELLQRWHTWRDSTGAFEDENAGSPAGAIQHLGRLVLLEDGYKPPFAASLPNRMAPATTAAPRSRGRSESVDAAPVPCR